MSGAHLVTDALQRAGITTIFSLSGNQIMPVYDACIDAGIRIVHVRHEAAAVYMADAWAQLTGQVGVALLTAAPGIMNGLSPVFSAKLGESPVLVLSGDSPVAQDGMGAFQELEQIDISRKLVKESLRLNRLEDIDTQLCSAMTLALSGRQGPVHVAMPFDLLTADSESVTVKRGSTPTRQRQALAEKDVDDIAQRMASAEKPLILLGPQNNASRARDLHENAGALQMPLIAMESPRGLRDPSLGNMQQLLKETDLILMMGKALDFSLNFGRGADMNPSADIIVVDPDEAMLARADRLLGERLYKRFQADADAALEQLIRQTSAVNRDAWVAHVRQALDNRQLAGAEQSRSDSQLADPTIICRQVQTVLDQAKDPILICDGGEFGQWAQGFCQAPTRIINGMSGAIGGGLCYAIAAAIARPDATIVALMGDGTVGFHCMEFETAAREGAAFTAVVGNDSRWNAEYMIQMRDYGPERLYGCTLSERVRYDQTAESLGARGLLVEQPEGISTALQTAVESKSAVCVNIIMEGWAAPKYEMGQSTAT